MPTLRERYRSWRGKEDAQLRAATAPIAFHPPSAEYYGPGVGSQPSHETLLQENIAVIDTATRAIANRLASLNPQVKVSRRDADGTVIEEVLDDHPLKILLDRPHPNYSRAQMLRLIGQYIVTVGEAYLLKVGNRLGVPSELHPMPPARVVPQLSQNVVGAYRVTDGGGQVFNLPADAIVRIYFPDPENPWLSEGYVGPTGIAVDSYKFASQHLRSHYEFDATPKTVLETNENAGIWDPEDQARFNASWRNKYHQRLGSERGNAAILPLGYKLVQMAMNQGAAIVPLLEHWQKEQLMAMGVPRSILGEVVSGDRSSAETNQYVFDKHTIAPIATIISDAFSHQLAPDFDKSLKVEFEQFVSDDKAHELAVEQSDLDRKVRTINQVREERGDAPVEWGEAPVGKLGELPYDPDSLDYTLPESGDGAIEDEGEEEPAPKPEPEDDADRTGKFNESEALTASNVLNGAQVQSLVEIVKSVKAEELALASAKEIVQIAFGIEPSIASKILAGRMAPRELLATEPRQNEGGSFNRARAAEFFTPETEWQRVVSREKKFIPAFAKPMRVIFRKQRDDVLAKLRDLEPRARVTAEELFDPADPRWAQLFKVSVDPVREAAFLEILAETLGGFGIEEFVFSEAMRQKLQAHGKELAKHVGRTNQRRIMEQLLEATENGEGVSQIAKRIRGVFSERSKRHAVTIARTEVGKAQSVAQLEGFGLAGVRKIRWLTSLDDAVRETHQIHGEIVEVGTPFTLPASGNTAAEQADAPRIGAGGTALSAANTINCRCYTLPVVED